MFRYLLALIAMSRPAQLLTVGLVYVFGLVIAAAREYALNGSAVAWGFVMLVPAAASIHFANEYADHETDARTVRTLFSGGSGAMQKYGISRQWALGAAWISLFLSITLVLIGYAQIGLAATSILCTGIFFGWMYSLKPLALAWRGWGEIDNAALGGLLLPLYSYTLLSKQIDLSAILAILPFTLIVFINLLATTWPDRKADASVQKFSLATTHSPHILRYIYWTTASSAFLLLPLLANWILPRHVVLACLLAVPIVVWGAIAYTRQDSPLPTVAAMIVMLVSHTLAWFASI